MISTLMILACGITAAAHADMPNLVSSSTVSVSVHLDDDCADANNTDITSCGDCCCVHSHMFSGFQTSLHTAFPTKMTLVIQASSVLHSRTAAPLYRPPIV